MPTMGIFFAAKTIPYKIFFLDTERKGYLCERLPCRGAHHRDQHDGHRGRHGGIQRPGRAQGILELDARHRACPDALKLVEGDKLGYILKLVMKTGIYLFLIVNWLAAPGNPTGQLDLMHRLASGSTRFLRMASRSGNPITPISGMVPLSRRLLVSSAPWSASSSSSSSACRCSSRSSNSIRWPC